MPKRTVKVNRYQRFKNGKWEHVTDYQKQIEFTKLGEELLEDIRNGHSIKLEFDPVVPTLSDRKTELEKKKMDILKRCWEGLDYMVSDWLEKLGVSDEDIQKYTKMKWEDLPSSFVNRLKANDYEDSRIALAEINEDAMERPSEGGMDYEEVLEHDKYLEILAEAESDLDETLENV